MSEKITVSVSVNITNGPTQAINQTVTVDAYDKFDLKVPDGTTAMNVDLQPGSADKVHFILVVSDQYAENLSYKVNGGTDSYILNVDPMC